MGDWSVMRLGLRSSGDAGGSLSLPAGRETVLFVVASTPTAPSQRSRALAILHFCTEKSPIHVEVCKIGGNNASADASVGFVLGRPDMTARYPWGVIVVRIRVCRHQVAG